MKALRSGYTCGIQVVDWGTSISSQEIQDPCRMLEQTACILEIVEMMDSTGGNKGFSPQGLDDF